MTGNDLDEASSLQEMLSTGTFPDWCLIDEVSLPLLEQGIARFDTLQALLPSLMTVNSFMMNEEETRKLPKLLRIAQMQIEHTLKSQYKLMTEIEELENKVSSYKREIRALRAKVEQKENAVYFQCSSCGKCFITQDFLATHMLDNHQ